MPLYYTKKGERVEGPGVENIRHDLRDEMAEKSPYDKIFLSEEPH